MNRVLYSLIFLMSSLPNTEKHLETLNSMIQAAQDSVKNIKSGLENFHSSMVQLAQAAGQPAGQPVTPPRPVKEMEPDQQVKNGKKSSAPDTPAVLIPDLAPAPENPYGK